MTDILLYPRAEARRIWRVWIALQELEWRSFEAHERRRIDAVGKIPADRPYGRSIPYAEAHGMHRIIEILHVTLMETQRHIA